MSSRAPVGYLAIAQVPLAVNQGLRIAMKCDRRISDYIHLFLVRFENMEIIKAIDAGGTTFAEISKKNFRPLKIHAAGDSDIRSHSKIFFEILRNKGDDRIPLPRRPAGYTAAAGLSVESCK